MERGLRLLLELVGPARIQVRVPRIPDYSDGADQARSARILREMGFTDLDLFDYVRPGDAGPHPSESR